MQRLLSFPLKDTSEIQRLRRAVAASPADSGARLALASALCRAGCTYEAAAIFRPLRSEWASTPTTETAMAALDAQGWWNKNWRAVARSIQSGDRKAALALLADRWALYWDLPPLLVHLGGIAAADGRLDLAEHLFQRVLYLSERGLPKMAMAAFDYVARASLVDIVSRNGDVRRALELHCAIEPNAGNAMAHEMQYARLLVAVGDLDAAMRAVASMLMTAEKKRAGYSRDMRLDFINASPDIAALRLRADWQAMIKDPAAYVRTLKRPK